MSKRQINRTYGDPLDAVWIYAAERMGMRIERSSEVFASWDGSGVLRIGTQETLDADDSVAQIILHEVCHALVEGPDAFHMADWGLDITDRKQRVREHACLRLQAALTAPYGLREFFAATTDFRNYYDALPAVPLAEGDDPAVPLAQAGYERSQMEPWESPLHDAIQATATIGRVVKQHAQSDSLWATVCCTNHASE